MTSDRSIRSALLAELAVELEGDPDVRIVQEFAVLNGGGRVDIAVIGRSLHGFEIKSDRDTLKRFPDQIRLFSAALDCVTLVVGWKHVVEAMRMIPRWWAVRLAETDEEGRIHLTDLREPRDNPSPDPIAVASLLWRDEALGLLECCAAADGFRSKRRDLIYERLATVTAVSQLKCAVVRSLKARGDGLSGVLSVSNGGSQSPLATAWYSPVGLATAPSQR
ncbi:MAG: sce7726 family protein [Gemmatimonadota bacterium]